LTLSLHNIKQQQKNFSKFSIFLVAEPFELFVKKTKQSFFVVRNYFQTEFRHTTPHFSLRISILKIKTKVCIYFATPVAFATHVATK